MSRLVTASCAQQEERGITCASLWQWQRTLSRKGGHTGGRTHLNNTTTREALSSGPVREPREHLQASTCRGWRPLPWTQLSYTRDSPSSHHRSLRGPREVGAPGPVGLCADCSSQSRPSSPLPSAPACRGHAGTWGLDPCPLPCWLEMLADTRVPATSLPLRHRQRRKRL